MGEIFIAFYFKMKRQDNLMATSRDNHIEGKRKRQLQKKFGKKEQITTTHVSSKGLKKQVTVEPELNNTVLQSGLLFDSSSVQSYDNI